MELKHQLTGVGPTQPLDLLYGQQLPGLATDLLPGRGLSIAGDRLVLPHIFPATICPQHWGWK